MKYEDAVKYLNKTAGFAKKTSLDNVKCLLGHLGNPQENLPMIHVAGTNGKGSVCMFLDALLRKSGQKTGVFTSPHILCINERILVSGKAIENDLFTQAFQKVVQAVDAAVLHGATHPSFFEFLLLMTLVVFQQEQPDYCVMETGMGGRLDATNVISPQLCILTSISKDHMEFLGDSITEIAEHKAGIIQSGVKVLSAAQVPEVEKVIIKKSRAMKAPFTILSEDNLKFNEKHGKYIDFLNASAYDKRSTVTKNLMGEFQKENLALALEALQSLGLHLTEPDIYDALKSVSLPGRMEQVMPGVFIDVAHNIQGMDAFCHTLRQHFPGKKNILFAVSHRNEEQDMQEILNTLPNVEWFQKIPVVGRKIGREDFQTAFEQMIEKADDQTTCFVVGSFYLAGETKQYISRRKEEC